MGIPSQIGRLGAVIALGVAGALLPLRSAAHQGNRIFCFALSVASSFCQAASEPTVRIAAIFPLRAMAIRSMPSTLSAPP